jgi:hypothetical protein
MYKKINYEKIMVIICIDVRRGHLRYQCAGNKDETRHYA